MDNKWQFGQLLENVQSRQFHSPNGESEVIRLSFGEDSVSLRCLQNRIVPSPFLPPLAKSPFRSPFPNLPVHSRPPSPSFCAAIAESEENCQNLPPPPLVPPPQSISLSCCGLARRGLQGSLNLLRPPLLLDRPCHPPSSTARRYLGVRPPSVGRRNGPILDEDDRVPV